MTGTLTTTEAAISWLVKPSRGVDPVALALEAHGEVGFPGRHVALEKVVADIAAVPL